MDRPQPAVRALAQSSEPPDEVAALLEPAQWSSGTMAPMPSPPRKKPEPQREPPNDFADPAASGPFHNPFASLGPLREELPPQSPRARPEDFPAEPPAKGPARAVVRLERKGRGGKEVTRVEGLGLPEAVLREWLAALKRALGAGGTVEEGALVLQGDHRLKLPDLLLRRGVRRVSRG